MQRDLPRIVQKAPFVVTLKPGRYAWCACGLSSKGDLCDGSHKGTGYKPVVFEIKEEKKVALCGCKHTKNPPYCDGTHKEL